MTEFCNDQYHAGTLQKVTFESSFIYLCTVACSLVACAVRKGESAPLKESCALFMKSCTGIADGDMERARQLSDLE